MTESFFQKLKNHFEQNLPFVAYANPKKQAGVKALLQKDEVLHEIKDFSEAGFVFAPFDDQKPSFYIPVVASEAVELKDFTSEENISGEKDSTNNPISENQKEKEAHVNLVSKGIKAIQNEDIEKIVLSRKEEIALQQFDVFQIFKKMLQQYSTAFVYLFFHPKIGLWMGATPETLLKKERNQLKTVALAGTQKFNGQIDVSWGRKEQEEQEFVTRFILKKLKKAGVGSIQSSGSYTAKAGNLLHIKTDISGAISSGNLKEIIASLHPTPAVCGMPREKAKEFILKEENYNREFYSGFLGELNMKTETKRSRNTRNQENQAYASVVSSTSLFVNLRCMKVEENKLNLYVGGGITKDSNPEAEWEETCNKAQTMKQVIYET